MIGVILTGYGGPDSLDQVEPFLSSIAGGRKFTPEQVEGAKKRYKMIGGKSPLNEITVRQAGALEAELNKEGEEYLVKAGMLHLPPRIHDVINNFFDTGIKKLAVVTLAPFRSRVSTAAYFTEAEKALKSHSTMDSVYVSGWNVHPGYLSALAEKINQAASVLTESELKDTHILFSIHSLPESYIQEGDLYVDDINETVKKLIPLITCSNWHVSYQSRGRGENWLGPDTETLMKKLAGEKVKNIIIAPIGFISDHVETLFDIDITFRKLAEELEVNMIRVPALNDSHLFICALADEIKKSTYHWI